MALAVSSLGYLVSWVTLEPRLGAMAGAAGVVPIALCGWAFGKRWGAAAGVALAMVSTALDPHLLRANPLQDVFGIASFVAFGLGAGWLGTLQRGWKLEVALRAASEQRMQAMLDALPDLLVRVGLDGTIHDLHAPAEQVASIKNMIPWATSRFQEHVPEALLPVVRSAHTAGFALAEVDGPGVPRHVEARAVRDVDGRVLLLLRDFTDRYELESQLVESERARTLAETRAQLAEADRLVALGTLAAGIAHEINSPLSYVDSNLEYLTSANALNDDQRGALADAREGVRRIKGIAADVKAMARGETGASTCALDSVIAQAMNLTRAQVRGVATVERPEPTDAQVKGNEQRLCQVLVNLVVNAAHAMPKGRPSAENRITLSVVPGPDGSCELKVADNGLGIPDEVKPRIFEMFFTTKPAGQGTGMGLAISRKLVEDAGGTLSFVSAPGRGTTFTVRLPRAAEPALAPALERLAAHA